MAPDVNKSLSVYQTLSHEIRTPLNAILGYSQLMKSQLDDPLHLEEYIDGIMKHGSIIGDLLNDLLIVYQIEQNQLNISLKKNELNRVLNRVSQSAYKQMALIKTSVTNLKINYSAKESLSHILTDAGYLKIVFEKIIHFILSNTQANTIWIGYHHSTEKNVTLFVSDENEADEFHHDLISVARKNTGNSFIGLSIAEAIITRLNGKIWIKPNIELNTTFFITIPHINKKNGHELEQFKMEKH